MISYTLRLTLAHLFQCLPNLRHSLKDGVGLVVRCCCFDAEGGEVHIEGGSAGVLDGEADMVLNPQCISASSILTIQLQPP
jgi:hypothetical protein